jgi:DNA-binding transcriptional LysR family regulator
MNSATREPINLNRLTYFAAVVDAGSFTRAAGRLGVTKAVVSQQLARLEQELAVTLLLRTTRSVTPTQAGLALYARCLVIMRESAAAFDELEQGTAEPAGTLRVAAPFDYGSSVLVPLVTAFTRTWPRCDVELMLSDRLVDLQSVDLAIRVGQLRDSSQIVRRLGTFEQYLVAAPEVLRLAGHLTDPRALTNLPFVSNRSLPEPTVWRFSHQRRGRRTVRLRARVAIDATPAVHAAVLAGAGLSVLPEYLVAADLTAGRLVRVLPEWGLKGGGINALLPPARFRPPRVTRFLELLTRTASTAPRAAHEASKPSFVAPSELRASSSASRKAAARRGS